MREGNKTKPIDLQFGLEKNCLDFFLTLSFRKITEDEIPATNIFIRLVLSGECVQRKELLKARISNPHHQRQQIRRKQQIV